MFKSLETKWNAHTPKFLHNRTKENLIFQLTLGAVLIAGFEVATRVQDRREAKKRLHVVPNKI